MVPLTRSFSKPFFVSLVYALLCSGASFGQSSLKTKLDSLLSVTSPRPFSGVIVISQNGKMIYANSAGFADRDAQTPLRVTDQFLIGSISKQTTAVLVLRELDGGRLSPDDRVGKYLPELKASWADSVTIHQLLTHTSGIESADKPLAFKPGTKFAYSPFLGYQLLAKIAEKTSGKPYATLTRELFSQCNMKNATIPALYRKGRLVSSYIEEPGGAIKRENYALKDLEPDTPAGAVIATAEDLARWNECLHNGKLLSEKSYKLMTTAYANRSHPRWGEVGYGYGLQVDRQDGQLAYSHSGWMAGCIGTNMYFPAINTSVVVLENTGWDFNNQVRAFYFHDQAWKLVKDNQLRSRN